jgi:hypothetical protein
MSVPSAGVGAVVRAPVAPYLARGLHASLDERQKYAKRVGISCAYIAGVKRGRNRSRQGVGVGHFDDVMGLGLGGRRP